MDEIIFDYQELFQEDTSLMSPTEASFHKDILETVGI